MSRSADSPTGPRTRLYRRSNPGERWWFAFLVLPAALTALLIFAHGEAIETELHDDAIAALQGAGLPGTTVEMSGRKASLSVPTGEDEDQALKVVTAVEGMGDVTVEHVAGTRQEAKACNNLQQKMDALNEGRGIPFEGSSANMSPRGSSIVPGLAKLLKRCPAARVVVEGHVDPTVLSGGTVSLKRANVVKSALVNAGVAAGRIEPKGFGDTFPLSPTNAALNNRVAVVLVGE